MRASVSPCTSWHPWQLALCGRLDLVGSCHGVSSQVRSKCFVACEASVDELSSLELVGNSMRMESLRLISGHSCSCHTRKFRACGYASVTTNKRPRWLTNVLSTIIIVNEIFIL